MGRVLVLVVAALAATVGWAPPASAETTISIRSTSGGNFIPERHVALVVTVTADRLIEGRIVVTPGSEAQGAGFSDESTTVAMQIGGGTTKEVVVTVPASRGSMVIGRAIGPGGQADEDLFFTVRLLEGSNVVAENEARLEFDPWSDTVGVLPGLVRAAAPLPERSDVRLRAGNATIVPVAIDTLKTPAALEAFDTIAGSADDLSGLSEADRVALGAWLAAGGHLLVDAPAGSKVSGLPDAWQPGAGGWATAGSGDVRLTSGRLASGQWEDVLDPAGSAQLRAGRANDFQQPWDGGRGDSSLASELGDLVGLAVPDLTLLFVGMGLYVFLIGPGVFFILKRRDQQAAAWLVVPAVSALLCVGLVVAGGRVRPADRSAHTTVVETGPWGAVASTSALVSASGAGTHRAEVPAGWVADGPDLSSFNSVPVATEVQADGLSFPIAFDSGQSSVVRASGPTRLEGTLELVSSVGTAGASSEPDAEDGRLTELSVTGTVRNTTPYLLRDVRVGTAESALIVGELAAGQTKTFRLASSEAKHGVLPETREWTSCKTCSTSPAGWRSFLSGRGVALHGSGTVFAVGWTDQMASEMSVDAVRVASGRTAIMTRSTSAALRAPVRPTDLRGAGATDDDLGVNGPLVRIALPATVTPDDIVQGRVAIDTPDAAFGYAVAANGRFERVVAPPSTGFVLRPEHVTDGVVFVRVRPRELTPDSEQDAAKVSVYVGGTAQP